MNFKTALLLFIIILEYNQTNAKLNNIDMQNKNIQYVTLNNGYRIWTKKTEQSKTPILLLHGGPGSTHEYFECFEQFLPPAGYQVIFYDQLGSYYSDQPTDSTLWQIDRFCEEVEQVRKTLGLNNFYLYGFSWGGILAIEYALKYQQHLKALIISNISASMKSYENYINELRLQLPIEKQKNLEYFYSKHFCRLSVWPQAITRTFGHRNKQVYDTMQGPNDFHVTGNLKEWDRWANLSKIHIPTLLIGAKYDVINPQDVRNMARAIPRATVFISHKGSHFTFYDDQKNYFSELISFLKKN